MKLNCDLGESFGAWQMGCDKDVIPHIDMANIACGFHAGDPNVIAQTLEYTKTWGTEIGAHPSYPDLTGFGRRNMQINEKELINLLHYQIAALDGMANIKQQTLTYVKPHGALYNKMMSDVQVRQHVLQAVSSYHRPLKLMLLATSDYKTHQTEAHKLGVSLVFEAFADRRYNDQGHLLDRNQSGAILKQNQILQQVEQLVNHGTVTTISGHEITIHADTLCVHGDNQDSINLIKEIRALCKN